MAKYNKLFFLNLVNALAMSIIIFVSTGLGWTVGGLFFESSDLMACVALFVGVFDDDAMRGFFVELFVVTVFCDAPTEELCCDADGAVEERLFVELDGVVASIEETVEEVAVEELVFAVGVTGEDTLLTELVVGGVGVIFAGVLFKEVPVDGLAADEIAFVDVLFKKLFDVDDGVATAGIVFAGSLFEGVLGARLDKVATLEVGCAPFCNSFFF